MMMMMMLVMTMIMAEMAMVMKKACLCYASSFTPCSLIVNGSLRALRMLGFCFLCLDILVLAGMPFGQQQFQQHPCH